MNTATELSRPGLSPTVPIPRIRAEPLASEPVDDTSSDGASWLSWRMSLAPEFCSVSAETAEIATGTSASAWARPCAVTTMSAPIWSSCVTDPAAVGVVVCVAALEGSGLLFWAIAGEAMAIVAADSRYAVRRMGFLSRSISIVFEYRVFF